MLKLKIVFGFEYSPKIVMTTTAIDKNIPQEFIFQVHSLIRGKLFALLHQTVMNIDLFVLGQAIFVGIIQLEIVIFLVVSFARPLDWIFQAAHS